MNEKNDSLAMRNDWLEVSSWYATHGQQLVTRTDRTRGLSCPARVFGMCAMRASTSVCELTHRRIGESATSLPAPLLWLSRRIVSMIPSDGSGVSALER
jgi:hypothetical protein